MPNEKSREQRLRRALRKAGYSLHKSRRGICINNLGGYRIVEDFNNIIVANSEHYNLSLDDVEEFLNE